MRQEIEKEILKNFFKKFSRYFKQSCKIYLTGGASAVSYGWRQMTSDIDLKVVPDFESFDAIYKAKNELNINLELASPDLFLPKLPNWESRSIFICKEGNVEFYHYDFYSQALTKLERGFQRDLIDVNSMLNEHLIEKTKLLELFYTIENDLKKFPAIDSETFKNKIKDFVS
jgi:hypothetical protein